MDTSSSSINRGMTSESNDSPNSTGSLRPEAAHIHPQALPNALPNVLLPVRDLIESNSGIIDTLTTLSLEQISEMESTLQRAKMIKIQQLNPSQGAVSLDTTAKSSRAQIYGRPILPNPTLPLTAILRQQMHETGAPTIQNDSRPKLSPSIRTINGVPWLTFQYTTRNTDTVITIRVDIDTTFEHNERSNDSFSSLIASEFRRANCIYPSADGPEQDYKGTRREFERECNEQGWKLAYLNPTVLGGKKGLLQRAVVSLRNATAEQKSRRVKRLEKKMKEQESITKRQGTEQQQQQHRGSVMAIPRISNMTSTSQLQRHDYRGHNHQNSITAQSSQSPRTLSWQPTLVSSLRNPTQSPNAQNAFSKSNLSRENLAWANIDDYRSEMQSQRSTQSNLDPTTYPLQRITLQSSTSQPVHNIDSSNAFSTSKVALPLSSSSFDAIGVFMNFDGFVQGRSQSLRIRCDIDHVKVEELPFDFKKLNCVYPRSFIALGAEDLGESPLSESHQSQQWKFLSVRQAEEIYLNEIGWKLASLNRSLLNGKRLLLQQALDAYRRRFLPATCHPRARVEPPFLTRMPPNSHDSELRPQETSGSYNSISNLGQRKQRVQYRIKFHGHGVSSRKAKRGMGSYESGQKSRASDDSSQDRDNDDNDDDDDDDDDDDTDDDTDDNGDDELNILSSSSIEDESSDSSSPEDAFHSQMSLLTFQGNIRTYCLGTGSGSARSRPRIKPIATSRVMNLRLPSSSPSNPVSSTTIRKRPNSGYPFQNQQQRQTHEGSRSAKRIRSHDPTEETDSQEERRPDDEEDTQEQDQTELDSVSSNSDVESKSSGEDLNQGNMDQYEEEDNWWMSRLQNSEYPEDHNFVSMTTEELIGALTSGYNSYIDDEEDESEEHTFF